MSHEHGLRPALEQAIKNFGLAHADHKLCVHEALQLTADLCRVIEPAVIGIGGDNAAFNALVADVEWAVMTYLVPWDIPFINNFVERILDTQAVGAVRPIMEVMRVKQDHPTN